ncbi:LysR family transcriptional regulator [Nocardia pseudovaccinii]|uniref:LysR family transcriptional regulator n=1 Tax=Nocardia pseudovaccinii TaxID=189540 RepID=UPI003D8CC0E8
MELRTLRYFVVVAEELHFGRAADRRRTTQPPLSRAIRQLEQELGCELLRRSPNGVALTPLGELLYKDARALLAQADRARPRVRGRRSVGAAGGLPRRQRRAGRRRAVNRVPTAAPGSRDPNP